MAKESTTRTRTENKLNYNTPNTVLQTIGRLTPQALDFEEALLGALMIDNEAVSTVIDFLEDKMFYKEAHQNIYKAIRELFKEMNPIDLLSVTNQLRKDGKLEFVGGPAFIASLTTRVASAANIEYYARIVMEKFVLRELITQCNQIITNAYDESNDVLQLLDKAETELFSIIQNNFKRDSKELNTVVKKALEELAEIQNRGETFHGVPTGINALDDKLGGWQKSDLIIIAARPGMGKTAFVLTVARNAAIDYQRPVAFFSLEMSNIQLAHRLFAIESGISSEKISKGQLADYEWQVLMDSVKKLETDNLIIDDTPALSIFDLRAKCRRLKHQHDIQLIIVDYLQLMQGDSDGSKVKGNREQEISYISRSLKALAKDLQVPVIALSQLSREVEKRAGDKRPQLSDLRESGSIEQDADMVMFIYRPEYYKMETVKDLDSEMEISSKGVADLMIVKNRHGAGGDVRLRFESQFTKFTDYNSTVALYDSPAAGLKYNDYEVDSKMNSDDRDSDSPDADESMPF